MALEITIDRNVIVFTVGITLGAAVLFGLVPAFHQAAVSLHSMLKEGGRTVSQGRARRRALGALVTAQIALSLALLVCAGIVVWDFLLKASRGSGIDPKQVLTADVRLTIPRYEDPVRQTAFFEEAVERLDALPGVVSAGATTALMHLDQARVLTFSLQGDAPLPRKDRFKTEYLAVSPGFLATLRVSLLRGRSLAPSDNAEALPVALVNQAFVRTYFRNDEPVGKHLRLDTSDSDRPDWSRIVGVVADTRNPSEQWEVQPQVYEPYLQRPSAAMTLVVRTTAPGAFAPVLRRTIWSIDKDQPISRVQTMEHVIADSRADWVMVATLLGSYAGLALAMAMVGVFGVVAYTVTQRPHEIGIRMALGAQTSDVVRMVATKGVVLAWTRRRPSKRAAATRRAARRAARRYGY
jgi:putative ABC transport system permease protein